MIKCCPDEMMEKLSAYMEKKLLTLPPFLEGYINHFRPWTNGAKTVLELYAEDLASAVCISDAHPIGDWTDSLEEWGDRARRVHKQLWSVLTPCRLGSLGHPS